MWDCYPWDGLWPWHLNEERYTYRNSLINLHLSIITLILGSGLALLISLWFLCGKTRGMIANSLIDCLDYWLNNWGKWENPLDPHQSGLKRDHLPEIPLSVMTVVLRSARENSFSSVLVLLGLSAVFDMMNHQILLSSLEGLGVSCSTFSMFDLSRWHRKHRCLKHAAWAPSSSPSTQGHLVLSYTHMTSPTTTMLMTPSYSYHSTIWQSGGGMHYCFPCISRLRMYFFKGILTPVHHHWQYCGDANSDRKVLKWDPDNKLSLSVNIAAGAHPCRFLMYDMRRICHFLSKEDTHLGACQLPTGLLQLPPPPLFLPPDLCSSYSRTLLLAWCSSFPTRLCFSVDYSDSLPVAAPIQFKTLVLYRAVRGSAHSYLQPMVKRHED